MIVELFCISIINVILQDEKQSRSAAKILIVVKGDGASVPEVIVRYFLWVQAMDSDVDIEVGLNVVTHFSCPFELLCSPTHAVGKRFVSRRHPTTLYACLLFLVSLLLFVLAKERSDGLDCLFRLHLLVATSRLSSLHELGDCPVSEGVVLPRYATLVLRHVIGVFLCGRVLG